MRRLLILFETVMGFHQISYIIWWVCTDYFMVSINSWYLSWCMGITLCLCLFIQRLCFSILDSLNDCMHILLKYSQSSQASQIFLWLIWLNTRLLLSHSCKWDFEVKQILQVSVCSINLTTKTYFLKLMKKCSHVKDISILIQSKFDLFVPSNYF
jgi:hypothetical protein